MESDGKSINIYEDIAPDQLDSEKVLELFSQSEKKDEPIALDLDSNNPIFLKVGRYGPYLQCEKQMKSLLLYLKIRLKLLKSWMK